MKHLRKCTALLLAVLMVLALAACGQKDDTAAVDKDLTVNVVSLNGTTSPPCRRTPPPRSTTRPTAPCRCSRSTRAACCTS